MHCVPAETVQAAEHGGTDLGRCVLFVQLDGGTGMTCAYDTSSLRVESR